MADDTMITDQELEQFFEAGRAGAPVPSDDLMARVLADAAALQARPAPVVPPVPRAGWVQRVLTQLGGWPAVAGLATATMAGVWIGYAAPAGLDSLTASVWPGSADSGYDVVDMIPSLSGFLVEGGA